MKSTTEKQTITHEAPGPKGCPFVGSLPSMSLNILNFFTTITAKYGDIALFKMGRKKVYLISHPKDIATLFAQERKGHYSRQFFYQAFKPAFGNGIFNSYGDDWKQQRAILQPYFQKKEIAKWFPLIQEETLQLIDKIAATETKNPIHSEKMILPLVQSIMSRVLFGRALQDNDSKQVVDAINTVSQQSLNRALLAHLFNGVFNRLPTPGNLKYQKALQIIEQSMRNLGKKAEQEEDNQSLIAKLAPHFNEQELRDHLFTLFFAGQDTSVNAIAFTLYYLGKYPDIQQRAREEINKQLADQGKLNYTHLNRLNYIESVIAESMRLAPPTYAVYRDVLGNQQINNTLIRDHSLVTVSPYITHRHADFWEDPESFNPERFLHGKPSEPFAFFPYGGGMRTCLGLNLARVEILTVVSLLLTRFSWTLPEGFSPKLETYMTLRAKKGIHLNLTPL